MAGGLDYLLRQAAVRDGAPAVREKPIGSFQVISRTGGPGRAHGRGRHRGGQRVPRRRPRRAAFEIAAAKVRVARRPRGASSPIRLTAAIGFTYSTPAVVTRRSGSWRTEFGGEAMAVELGRAVAERAPTRCAAPEAR